MSTAIERAPSVVPLTINRDRIYANHGNAPLIRLLDRDAHQVLDVGCGAGDNAELVQTRFPGCQIHGITHSRAEAEVARPRMSSCTVWDIEGDIPVEFDTMRFDAIIFSHVLEHLREPDSVLHNFSRLLKDGGVAIIAVPNVLSWAMRWQFLCGNFEYRSDGILDNTHLRFFTYFTAERYLLSKSPELKLVFKGVTGSVPQWWLRRFLLPKKGSEFIDTLGCRIWPNLFGGQILLRAVHDRSNVGR